MGSLHAPKGLERVNPTVFRLQQDLHAWNIDGSSVDKPEVGSWIKFWEDSTGRSRSRCAYSDCPKQAEHGGHVWITGGHSSMQHEFCWIVPICAECNSSLNDKRMQNSEGNHSCLRVGCLVVKTPYTEEMRTAPRRSGEGSGGARRGSGGGQPYSPRRSPSGGRAMPQYRQGCCFRCGRDTHMAYDCYARTDINGQVLSTEISISSPPITHGFGTRHSPKGGRARPRFPKGSCYKCGRDSHMAYDCYARTGINGEYL